MATVYVRLLDEGVDVWRPVQAKFVEGDVYELSGPVPEEERWEYAPGSRVRCRMREFEGGTLGLVVVGAAEDA